MYCIFCHSLVIQVSLDFATTGLTANLGVATSSRNLLNLATYIWFSGIIIVNPLFISPLTKENSSSNPTLNFGDLEF